MALGESEIIDAIGVEMDTSFVVLSILDEWDWDNEGQHLLALQAKLNGYFHFVESGQVYSEYPASKGRQVVIDVVGRFSVPQAGRELLRRASIVASEMGVQVRVKHYPGNCPANDEIENNR